MDCNYLSWVYKNASELDEFMGEHAEEGKLSDCLESWLFDMYIELDEEAPYDTEEVNILLNNHRVQSEIKRLERTTD